MVRQFFGRYNRNYAEPRGLRFEVIDWENYSSAGVGRPQELITEQTLERYKESLAIVIGIMAQRFGSPSGERESGTEEEFEWAIKSQRDRQFPIVKWFFRDIEKLTLSPKNLADDVAQWNKVEAFRKRVDEEKKVFFRSYRDLPAFEKLLEDDVAKWIARPERPWFRNFRESEAGSAGFADWPEQVVADLAARLDDEFVRYMQSGESLSAIQARKRYVASVVRRRPMLANVTFPKDREEEPLAAEGGLEEFLSQKGVHLLLIGPGGRGKTTTLRHLAAEGARRAVLDPNAPICVYLSLTTFEADDDAFRSLLNRLCVAAGLECEELTKRWQSGPRPLLFLLDALNEVSRAHAEGCTRALMTLLQGSYPQHRYIITARPGTDLESIAERGAENLQLRVFDLLKFSTAQVSAYLKAQGQADLQSRISDQLEGLASNPFLLWAITRVLTAPTAGQDKWNRGTLFQALIDHYIFEQREKSKPKPRPTTYNFELVKKPVLAALASKMIEDGVTQVTDRIELWTQVAERLKELADKHQHVYPLEPETFMPPQFAAVTLLSELLDNGVLVREGSNLRFMHESVQEYFAAVALRDRPVEDLAARAPVLNLARPDARGPMFETLVTWAGLMTSERVADLALRLGLTHPLLAVHICSEALLSGQVMEEMKRAFFAMTESEHEARVQVGLMGLALMGPDDPAVVERLVDALELGSRWTAKDALTSKPTDDALELDWSVSQIAERALTSKPTDYTIRALVKACLASSAPTKASAAGALKESAKTEPRRVAAALVEAWRSPANPDAVTELAIGVDTDFYGERHKITEALIDLSTDAELEGDLELSRAIDGLRDRMDKADRPRFVRDDLATLDLAAGVEGGEGEARLEELAETCKTASDQELARLLETKDIRAWRVIRAELMRRSAGDDLALATVVSNAIAGLEVEWLKELDALPAKLVQRELADRQGSLQGNALRRAQLLAELLADQPSMASLRRVFSESGSDLRMLAAHAAVRTGAQGVACLSEMLRQEDNREVIEAGIEGLGKIGTEEAVATLQDLLLSPAIRSHWPRWPTAFVEDPETGHSFSDDDWDIRIQGALLSGGAADETLRRLMVNLMSREITLRLLSVDAAGRWQDRPTATELLKQAQQNDDPRVRARARWYLARSGNPAAWRALIESEVRATSDFASLVHAAARRFDKMPLEPSQEQPLIDAAHSVLRPLLRSSDADLRTQALNLTHLLPRAWISDAWRAEALALGEDLLASGDVASRRCAVRSIAALAADGEDRLKALLLGSADKNVREVARTELGDKAYQWLSIEVERALESGDYDLALRAGQALGRSDRAKESAVKWLREGDVAQCAAAIAVLSQQWIEYFREEERAKIRDRVAAAFERHGVADLWNSYAVHLRSTPERDQQCDFTRVIIFDALWNHPKQLRRFVSDAQEIWPEDLEMLGTGVVLDIRLDDKDRAAESIEAIRKRFGDDKISPRWLGDRYAALDRPADALEHYRRSAEQNPDDDDSHFSVGWWAFMTGDLESSIEASRRCLVLEPTNSMTAFNLGLALLARGETGQAELSYRKAVALARRYGADAARKAVDGALSDFPLLTNYKSAAHDAQRIREWLQVERNRLDVGHSSDL
jgi:tetratricopeptide (TPR) repeat protein